MKPSAKALGILGIVGFSRLLKNAHLLRFPHPSSLQRTTKYASLLGTSGALHLDIFDQPEKVYLQTLRRTIFRLVAGIVACHFWVIELLSQLRR